jgi:hypothetical protein
LAEAAAARASVVVAVAHASVVVAADHASVEVAARALEAVASADVRSAAALHSVQDETLAPDVECADLAISRFEVPSTDGTAAGVTVGVTIIAAGASSSAHRTSTITGIMITATTVTIAGGSIAEQSAPAARIGGAVTDYVRIENA